MNGAERQIKDIKEVSIAIDTWDDIFSDFDPRPLGERVLSEDFLAELKKRYRETRTGRFLISICAPVSLEDAQAEKVVIQRLKRDFKHKVLQRQKEIMRIRLRGAVFVMFGVCNLGILTLITYFKVFNQLNTELLAIILMPLGWFGIWEGFSKIIDTSPMIIQEEKLFNKLANADYKFKYIQEERGRTE